MHRETDSQKSTERCRETQERDKESKTQRVRRQSRYRETERLF